jgi:hypothetical protein
VRLESGIYIKIYRDRKFRGSRRERQVYMYVKVSRLAVVKVSLKVDEYPQPPPIDFLSLGSMNEV